MNDVFISPQSSLARKFAKDAICPHIIICSTTPAVQPQRCILCPANREVAHTSVGALSLIQFVCVVWEGWSIKVFLFYGLEYGRVKMDRAVIFISLIRFVCRSRTS